MSLTMIMPIVDQGKIKHAQNTYKSRNLKTQKDKLKAQTAI